MNCENCAAPMPTRGRCEYCGTDGYTYARAPVPDRTAAIRKQEAALRAAQDRYLNARSCAERQAQYLALNSVNQPSPFNAQAMARAQQNYRPSGLMGILFNGL